LPIQALFFLKGFADKIANLILEAKKNRVQSSHFQRTISSRNTKRGERLAHQILFSVADIRANLDSRSPERLCFGLKHKAPKEEISNTVPSQGHDPLRT
jgi:hypothetical protein